MAFTTYYGDALLDDDFASRGTHVALHDSDPTVNGNSSSEVSGGSYARQGVTWGSASSRTVSNTDAQSFGGLPATTITHIGVWDAAVGGNLLAYQALASSVVVASGGSYVVGVGELSVSID